MTATQVEGPVLVTGAGGCIGGWVLSKLVAAGVETAAFDLSADRRRPALLMDDAQLAQVRWMTGDIADKTAVNAAVAAVQPRAIIHLAGLQVPFCKSNPVLGAQVNVVGTLNVLDAAREHGILRLGYASSVAAHGDGPDSPWLKTLYGAYKHCNEESARTYWRDWEVPSVGLRPNIVYGVARDQGMSSMPTVAMLAAVCGAPYTVPFRGALGLLYTEDIAEAFIRAVARDGDDAYVFDCNGSATTVEACMAVIRDAIPGAEVRCEGEALPFPGDLDNTPVSKHLDNLQFRSLDDGVRETIARFRVLHQRGLLAYDPSAMTADGRPVDACGV